MNTSCCDASAADLGTVIDNRPGLGAIAFRIATFESLRDAALAQLVPDPALRALTTRASDDYAITLFELFAAVGDVLTFYQERIANEAYLRTATQRDSIARLVRLIDYQLGRGAAATVLAAFTLERGAAVPVPVGLRMQSVASGVRAPQKFETIEAIAADARFNRLRLVPAPVPVLPTSTVSGAYVTPGIDTAAAAGAWAAGDRLMLWNPQAASAVTLTALTFDDDRLRISWTPPAPGALGPASVHRYPAVKVGRTFHLLGHNLPAQYSYAYESSASPPDPSSVRAVLVNTDTTFAGYQASGSDPHPPSDSPTPASNQLLLDAVYPGLTAGARLLIEFMDSSNPPQPRVFLATAESVAAVPANRGPANATVNLVTVSNSNARFDQIGDVRSVRITELLGPLVYLWQRTFPARLVEPVAYVPGARAGWDVVDVGRTWSKGAFVANARIAAADLTTPRRVLLTDGASTVSGTLQSCALVGDTLTLTQTADDLLTLPALGFGADVARRQTALVSAVYARYTVPLGTRTPRLMVQLGSRAPQLLTLQLSTPTPTIGALALALQRALTTVAPNLPGLSGARVLRDPSARRILVVPGSPDEAISFAGAPVDTVSVRSLGLDVDQCRYIDGWLSGPIAPLSSAVSGGRFAASVDASSPAAVQAPITLSPGAGAAQVARALLRSLISMFRHPRPIVTVIGDRVLALPPVAVVDPPAYLRLGFALDDDLDLDATSSAVLANVALASHGETVRGEVLGSGDASVAFQHFALRKQPLTYVLDSASHDLKSTLTVTVDGITVAERPTLYGSGPGDQVYATRMEDDGTVVVGFGDGVQGARVATGRSNVLATYRQGTGVAGRIAAGALTSLIDRPTGLKGVINPLAADGGADPEDRDSARTNAPNTVRTFGRAVSLRDFEDLTLEGGEVAKAAATWVWNGDERVIHLTVAAQGGGTFSSLELGRLRDLLLTKRDPNWRLLISNYQPVAIAVAATLNVDPRFDNGAVQAAGLQAVLALLSFDQMTFHQAVHLSRVYAALQAVPGVSAVDVILLAYRRNDAAFLKDHPIIPNVQAQPHLFILPARPGGPLDDPVLPAELAVVAVPSTDVLITATGGRGSP